MKRRLKSSEKVLIALCTGVLVLLAGFLTLRDHRARIAVALEKIENLEPQLTAAVAAAADAPFWDERQAWLDATMPVMGDSGQAHSSFCNNSRRPPASAVWSSPPPFCSNPKGVPTTATCPLRCRSPGRTTLSIAGSPNCNRRRSSNSSNIFS